METKNGIRYLILSDLHIPDQDDKSLALVFRFIGDFKPHFIYLLGDQVNFTRISKYDQDPHYNIDIVDEIKSARSFLGKLVGIAKRANKKVTIVWFDGNHEERLFKYLARNAASIAKLNIDGELLVSIQHLLELNKLGIKYVPYREVLMQYNTAFMHGTTVRSKSGYTGQANMDKFGTSGFSGHTHRLSYTTRTQMGNTKWWVETGCLCNMVPTPQYTLYPDWCQGFAVAEYDSETDQLYAAQVPIVNHSFRFNGKTYRWPI